MAAIVKIPRGTTAALDALALANGIVEGQLYWCTDALTLNVGFGVDQVATVNPRASANSVRTGTATFELITPAALREAARTATMSPTTGTISINLNNGWNFGGSASAALVLSGNATINVSGGDTGSEGWMFFKATGATRTLTLGTGGWVLASGVTAGPYSITVSETLGIRYVKLGSNILVSQVARWAV